MRKYSLHTSSKQKHHIDDRFLCVLALLKTDLRAGRVV